MAMMYQNKIYDSIMCRLNLENALYLSIQNILFLYLIYKNRHIEAGIFKTIMEPVSNLEKHMLRLKGGH
jgi:hypothetical protein